METIRGSTEACLQDYLRQLPPATTRKGIEARKPIVKYCQCNPSTVRRWTLGTVPMGMMLVRARYFLASVGYTVDELLKLHPVIRQFGKLIVDGVLDPVAMRERLRYQDDYAILAMLHGSRLPTDDRMKIIRQIVAEQQPAPPATQASVPDASVPQVSSRSGSGRKLLSATARKCLIESTAKQIAELLPNVELLTGDTFTDTERERIRELAGKSVVFETAVGLYKLTGERARSIIENDPTTGGIHE